MLSPPSCCPPLFCTHASASHRTSSLFTLPSKMPLDRHRSRPHHGSARSGGTTLGGLDPSPRPRQLLLDHADEILQWLDARQKPAVDEKGRVPVTPTRVPSSTSFCTTAWCVPLWFSHCRCPTKKRRHRTPSPWSGERSDDACSHSLMYHQSVGYTTGH